MTQIVDTGFGQHGISYKKFWIHSASFLTINSNSIVDLAIHICLKDFHDTTTLPNVKTYSLVYFESLVLHIQLEPLYLSSTTK